jgi:hypothetical protein
MSCRKPCEGCAFTEGSAANREPYNALKAQICLLGGIPFHCHHNIEWWKPEAHKKKTRAQVQQMEICGGWQREVAKLAATGYFKTLRAEKKVYGQLGLGALETFVGGLECKKAMARRTLDRIIRALVKERDRAEAAWVRRSPSRSWRSRSGRFD